MKFWKKNNDLYTGDVQPVEDAVEITEQEYIEIYSTREITHLPPVELSDEELELLLNGLIL